MTDLNPSNYWPLGSTVQETTSLADTSYYRHFGIISVNPIDGHMVLIYRRGSAHLGSSELYIRHSLDGGMSWGTDEFMFSDGSYDLRGVGGGFTSSGKLLVFYTKCIFTPPNTTSFISMFLISSINNGYNWNIPPLEIYHPLPDGVNAFLPYGHIIDVGNNVLYQTWYESNYLTPATYWLHLFKSTDGGSTFQTVIDIYSGNEAYTEPSMVNLGGGCFLLLARINNQANKFMQIKSENNCVSWGVPQGITGFESTGSAASPPFLSYINYEGVGIVACYYTIRDSNPPVLKVVFGLAKNLLDDNIGVNGWIATTKKIINDAYNGGNNVSGYQSIFLPLNQYKGIGVCFKEVFVGSDRKAYPVIIFTNISGMKDVLLALGL